MTSHNRLLWTALATLSILLSVQFASGQETIVIHDVTVIDGTGSPPRKHVDLVLSAGRIASVNNSRTYRHPANARVNIP